MRLRSRSRGDGAISSSPRSSGVSRRAPSHEEEQRGRGWASRALRATGRAIASCLRTLVFPVLAAGVVSVVFLVGMFPARAYLQQKEAITDAQQRLAALTEQNREAEDELARLSTDAEIERVAREQYGLVKPGEEVFHVMPAPQDPVAVPDVWPFDGMRKRLKAQPPTVIDPAGGGTSTTATAGSPATP